ncbi:biotin carboxylase N-terminal domain-containing protein [soil metagenome]
MTQIRTLLIANRGEIACRIIRSARASGIRTVAVFSDADADALFVTQADIAVRLPGVTPAQTYLRGDLIIAAAKQTGADAIHPGYGFLSENAEFAQSAADAGIIFVGPTPAAITAMGSKIRAKEMMAAAGVPILPGATVTGESSEQELIALVAGIGYPLLVKASAGGGGRGMRIVNSESEIAEAVASARREAGSAFGDDTVFVEKYVTSPRHVEVQIFGDTHGTVVHLFERDCSIQRRYQKIIEESPSPAVTPELRERLGAAAVAAGRRLGYVGAGTVEFILDPSGDFHFLEVNTRLQVEHPVTELVTGLDLVRLQLLVAQGEALPAEVVNASMTGHAIEVRLYAEDPAAGFLPTSGLLRDFTLPDWVRVDTGFVSGDTVSIHYDPMLAKVIAHAPTRTEAALALANALRSARIHGVGTNRDVLVGILTEPEFLAGSTDTAYLERHSVEELTESRSDDELRLGAAAAALAVRADRRQRATVQTAITPGFRNVRSAPALLRLADSAGVEHDVHYEIAGPSIQISVDGVTLGEGSTATADASHVTLETAGLRRDFSVSISGSIVDLDGPFGGVEFSIVDLLPPPGSTAAAGSLSAPMPGTVVRTEVEPGTHVRAGQPIVVLEAMKMEHAVRAPNDGIVESVLVSVGEQVDIGQVLAIVVEATGEADAAA